MTTQSMETFISDIAFVHATKAAEEIAKQAGSEIADTQVQTQIAEAFPVLIYPNSILKEVSEPVNLVDDKIRSLIHNLFITMYSEGGVGLAAIQCGIKKRIFVMDVSNSGKQRRVFINPVIEASKDDTERCKEGCLSFPDIFAFVKRSSEVSISALNEKGELFKEKLTGIEAICFQHELDHLDGITFYDHLSPLQKNMLKKKILKMQKKK